MFLKVSGYAVFVTSTSRPSRSLAQRRVRRVIERLVRERSALAADGTKHTLFPVAVDAAEGEALRDWVVRESASQTVEIGLGYGLSALFICEGLLATDQAAPRHVVVDPQQATRFQNLGRQFLDEAGVTHLVEHHPMESHIALPRLLSAGRSFDLAFVDGNHRFDGVFVDLVYLGRLVHPRGVIILDDFQLPAVARAVRFFQANLGWTIEEVSALDDLHHWAVVRTSASPDRRPFDFFVDF